MFKSKKTAYDQLKSSLSKDLSKVDALIIEKAKSNVALIPKVANYLTGAGGKRLRPLLTIAASSVAGKVNQQSVLLATAVEFIHTATLLHDDVIDESELRRGMKTANNVWDNKTVILVGDYLFSQAFKMMVKTENIAALQALSDASADIISSEVFQLELLKKNRVTKDDYFKLIKGKTARLFEASMESGAIVATDEKSHILALKSFGYNLGMAFQAVDDYLDYFAKSNKFGKTKGNDFFEGKMTLPAIYAIEEDANLHKLFLKKNRDEKDLELFMSKINVESIRAKIKEDLQIFTDAANKALEILPSLDVKNNLLNLMAELNERKV